MRNGMVSRTRKGIDSIDLHKRKQIDVLKGHYFSNINILLFMYWPLFLSPGGTYA
jgi:hypothetical protein